jgi:hypothetical protein
MEKIDYLSLEKHDGPYEAWPLVSRLFAEGKDTQWQVPGYVIEAQYRWGEYSLVITSMDCPYEESNHFLLLNSDFEIVSRRGLGTWYDTWLLANHWPVSANAVRLHYFAKTFFTLTIQASHMARLLGPKLVLDRFTDIESDPRAIASLREWEDREAKTRAYLNAQGET